MASIETLHPLVAPEVLGCPSITIDSAILRAAIEFCEKSTAWRELLDPITVVDGTAEYALTIPADARLVALDASLGLTSHGIERRHTSSGLACARTAMLTSRWPSRAPALTGWWRG